MSHAVKITTEVDVIDPVTGVHYVQSAPGNGWTYGAFVTPLPADVEGGSKAQHVLVSIFWPGGTAAHVFAKQGHLMAYYAIDKLKLEGTDQDHIVAIVDLIRFVLQRDES